MAWFCFTDMHSGGGRKTDWEQILIEAETFEAATECFSARTGRDPDHVTCDCCGPDFSSMGGTDYETLAEAGRFWSETDSMKPALAIWASGMEISGPLGEVRASGGTAP